MSTATTKNRRRPANPPEFKIGPFQGGIGVAVWLNEVESGTGTSQMRSITIAPRRYLDKVTNEWKNAGSYRPADLTALILSLEKVREFCLTQPLPGESSEDERLDGFTPPEHP